MKKKFLYIIISLLTLLLWPNNFLFSQGDSSFYKIIFDCDINFDSAVLNQKDYTISVLIDSVNYSTYGELAFEEAVSIEIAKRVDYIIDQNSYDFSLNAFGCKTDKITYTVDSSRSFGMNMYVSSFFAESYSIEYPASICQNSQLASPLHELPMTNLTLSSEKGLTIDNEGRIDAMNSAPGNYIIGISSDYCLSSNAIPVSILPQPDFEVMQVYECDRTRLQLEVTSAEKSSIAWSDNSSGNETEVFKSSAIFATVTNESGCVKTDSMFVEVRKLEFETPAVDKQESDCWIDGKVEIKSASIRNNVGEYSYRLQNTLNNSIVDNMDEVPEGEYNIQVVDSRDCISSAKDKITIIQKCIENYPVFTPNYDGVEDQYFIPYEGTVKIFNSENRLVKELESPIYWDGSDQNGVILPMGNYVMITDHGRPVNITIVR